MIHYSTQHTIDGGRQRVVRPRIVIYGTILAILSAGFVAALLTRLPVELDVIRDRNALYRESRPGFIENVYTLRIINKDTVAHAYTVTAAGLPTLSVEIEPPLLSVAAGEVATVAARVLVEDGVLAGGRHDIALTLEAADDQSLQTTEMSRFFAP